MKSFFLILVFLLLVFKISISCVNYNQNNREIYYSNSFPWYIFYDSCDNKCDIVEIGGIKYGFIDRLIKVNKSDTISKSKFGILFNKNNELIYLNFELNKEFKLKKIKYNSNHKSKRNKIFSTFSNVTINKYSISDEKKSYTFKVSLKDFENFEKNQFNTCEKFNFEKILDSIR